MFGSGMIKKVLFYLMLGPIGMLLGGNFNIMDFFLIPMIAPMFQGMFPAMGGSGPAAAGATT